MKKKYKLIIISLDYMKSVFHFDMCLKQSVIFLYKWIVDEDK